MEVFGSGYSDDVDYIKYNQRQSQTHKEAMIIQLKWVLRVYELALFCLKMQDVEIIKGTLSTYHSQFTKFLKFQQEQFKFLLKVQIDKEETLNDDFSVTHKGHLVQFSCGHRGQPSRIEEKRVSRLLRKSGFIPMLEEMQPKTTKD